MRHGNHVTATAAEGEGFQIEQRKHFCFALKVEIYFPAAHSLLSFPSNSPAFTLFQVSHSMSSRVSDHLRPSCRFVGSQHYPSITSRHTLALFAVRLKFLCC